MWRRSADFGVNPRLAAGGGQFEKLPTRGFFIQPLRQGRDGRVVHDPAGRQPLFFDLLVNLARVKQRGQLRRQTLEQAFGRGAVFLFRGLDRVPLMEHGLGCGQVHLAKNVRMAADELVVDLARHILEIKVAGLGRHLRVHDDVQEQIAEFLAHVRKIAPVNRIEQFGDLLDQAVADALVRLFQIPRTTPRAAQPRHRLA